jgi:tight adherence protein B
MELTTLSIVLLVLFLVPALMYYEHSRRSEIARNELLRRRLDGAIALSPRTAEVKPEADHPQPSSASRFNSSQALNRWLAQAGIGLPAGQFLTFSIVAYILVASFIALWLGFTAAGFCIFGFVGLLVGYVVIRRGKRLSTFNQQLPYVLDFMRSALRAGHPLARTLQMSAENAPEPIATELRLALDQMRFGSTLPDALMDMFRRVPEESLGFLVAAVRVQADVGSSIAEILDRVTETIRDRQRLYQHLKALTAQARMSGIIVGALPVLMLLVFSVLRPDYVSTLFHDPIGIKMLEVAIGLEVGAFLVIRHMLRLS